VRERHRVGLRGDCVEGLDHRVDAVEAPGVDPGFLDDLDVVEEVVEAVGPQRDRPVGPVLLVEVDRLVDVCILEVVVGPHVVDVPQDALVLVEVLARPVGERTRRVVVAQAVGDHRVEVLVPAAADGVELVFRVRELLPVGFYERFGRQGAVTARPAVENFEGLAVAPVAVSAVSAVAATVAAAVIAAIATVGTAGESESGRGSCCGNESPSREVVVT